MTLYFYEHLYFQVTALMGAHSLGGAREANSGYAGAFTPPNTGTFDNEYYQLLANDRAAFTNEVGVVHCHKI